MVWFRENWYEEVSRQLRQGLAKCLAIAFENRGAVSEATITPHTLNFVKKLVSTFGIGIGGKQQKYIWLHCYPLTRMTYPFIRVEVYKRNWHCKIYYADFSSGFFTILLIFFLQNYARTSDGKSPRHRQEDNTELGLQKR
jgi:hypothetical protein